MNIVTWLGLLTITGLSTGVEAVSRIAMVTAAADDSPYHYLFSRIEAGEE